jgi:hypothetical protein
MQIKFDPSWLDWLGVAILGANLVTNKLKAHVLSNDANLDAGDIRFLFLKSSAPTADTNFVTDLTPGTNELTVGGYARQALDNKTVTEDDANDFAYLDADDEVFASLATGETITWGILFRQVTNDTDSPVYAGYDFTDTPTNGGNITVQWAAPASGGVLKAA